MFTTLFRLCRIICLLCAALALGACSTIKLGYNTLPEIATWWADGYADLDDAQESRLRENIARLQQWHRQEELPRYADLLQRVEAMAASPVQAQQVCGLVAEIRGLIAVVAHRAQPALTTMALGLTPAQLQHLERKYAKNNAQYGKDWIGITAAELADKRFDQALDRSETVYGRLQEPQKAALREQLERFAFDPRRALALRQLRQQDILAALRKLAGQPVSLEEAQLQVKGLLARLQESPDAAGRAWQEAQYQAGCAVFSATHNATTPEQRDTAARRLRAWQRDLRELAAQR